ncbi:MAG: hydrogenase [Desulfobacteraceae bacterium]|nr:MAG: hydrogenase [Desulfobacteraceae bacterium]
MVEIVFLIPFLTGIAAFFLSGASGRMLLVITGAFHLLFSVMLLAGWSEPFFPAYFSVTPEGLLSLIVISLLFFLISIYTTAYIKKSDIRSENIFTGSMLLFLSTMTMVTLSDHIMVMWIAIEATTLASAPLIYTHRSAASLEATWKYVLVCSVGIALALLGSVLITLSMDMGRVDVPVSFSALTAVAKQLDPLWLKTGFVFILVGYGTKMGLAPMHTWLPDAHGEAPSPASALLSGVLLNCAYLGIFKTHKIMIAAGLESFSGTILMVFGLMSMLAAATFILKQTEYKRLLAYSSIENMGIIAFGTGIGGLGAYGAMLCLIHHSLIKSSLFLASGNIFLAFGSRLIEDTGSLVRRLPQTFIAFFSGFIGIAGLPPFGIFIGELFIIMGAFSNGHYVAAGIFILSLCVVFAGFANHVLKISFEGYRTSVRMEESINMIWPPYALLLTSLLLCFWIPETFSWNISQAVKAIGGVF